MRDLKGRYIAPAISAFPPSMGVLDTYIETHLGGGAVMRKKPPARNNIAIYTYPSYAILLN
jgi:hypothetical protein